MRRHLANRESGLPWLFLSEHGPTLTRQAVGYSTAESRKSSSFSHAVCFSEFGTEFR